MRQITFQGVVPKLRTEKLPPNFANNAENCLLHSGAIVPLKSLRLRGTAVDVSGQLLTAAPDSLYRIGDIDLGFSAFTVIAEDPLHREDPDAFLYVADGKLMRSSPHWIMDKLGPVKVGIEAPCKAPETAIVDDGNCEDFGFTPDCWSPPYTENVDCDAQNNLPPQVLSFCYTWLTACSEESGPSPYCEPILVQRGESVLLATVDTPPDNATAIRWYMAVADKDDAIMLFIGETTLPDAKTLLFCPDEFAGDEALMTEGWMPMRCGQGVANLGVNSVIVWSGQHLYPSVPGQPHAYMEEDRLKIDWPIVRVISRINAAGLYEAVVLTTGKPYTVTRDDGNKAPVVRLVNRMAPCLNPQAVMVVGDTVYYMSEEGIVSLTGNAIQIITSRWFDTAAWHKIGVHHYTLGYYDQRIFAFATSSQARSFMVPAPMEDNPYERQDLVYLSHRVTALYTDNYGEMVVTGIGKSASTWRWEAGDVNMLATWECRTVQHAAYTHFTAAKVLTDSIRVSPEAWPYVAIIQETLHRKPTAQEAKDFVRKVPEAKPYLNELTGGYTQFTLIVRKRPFFTRYVWGEEPFRLPRDRRATEWGFSIRTTEPVYEVHMQQSFNNLVQEGGVNE